MKILIAGSEGMLGSDLVQELGRAHQVLGLGRRQLDITNPGECSERIAQFRPDVTVNAAGMTDVDGCETRQEEAFRINGQGPGNLAAAAARAGSMLVHYSTDYVFDGAKPEPYREEDAPNPLSVYGKSKLRGDEMVRDLCPEHLILRTSWVFGKNGSNFIRTIAAAAREGRGLRVVHDQRGCPSYSLDLAIHTRMMLEAGCRGAYHLTNRGSCTWFELAVHIVRWLGLQEASVTPVSTEEYHRVAPRPANSVLANARLEREGIPLMRPWQEAAQDYMDNHLSRRSF